MQPRSLGTNLLIFALGVLAACWTISSAVRLLEAIWPVLAGGVLLTVGGAAAVRFYRQRDYW